MDELAKGLGKQDLSQLSDLVLAGEILRRQEQYARWEQVYGDCNHCAQFSAA